MVTLEQKEQYIAELRMVVERWPRSFVNYIDSKGLKKSTSNRQYLRDFIKEETPLLDSPEYKMGTKLYWIFNGITSWDDPRVCCRQCGKPFIGKNVASVREGYVRFCSRRCQYDSPEVQDQIRETCLERYGVTNAYLIPDVVQSFKDRKEEIQRKRDETKRLHHSFRDSDNERKAGEILKQIYPDLILQYKSEKYPFNCDFYSPSEDLFMEFNGSWTHGRKFYDPSDETCQETLKEWEEKAKVSKFYVNAIKTWTVRDVSKKKFSEENNLKYLVFWSLQEVVRYANNHGVFVDFKAKRGRTPISLQTASDICKEHSSYALSKYKESPFPYPKISDKQIEWEIEALSTRMISDKQFSPMIRKYHQSIWNCSKGRSMSPVKFWEKFKESSQYKWNKFYTNRLVHAGLGILEDDFSIKLGAIRQGFEVLRYCSCVSYLKPFLAKRLIQTYLSDASEIFCPMNGFSGFMLGASLGCNLRYIGQDINERQILEAKEIAGFLERSGKVSPGQISLSAKDMFEDSGKYDCLVVCPPYSDKERWNFDVNGVCTDRNLPCGKWMDEILSRYSCRKYLFVVDGEEDTKYDDHIVERLSNRSHFSENFEKVIVMS